ncbi:MULTISPECIES: hypothetical protein [Bacillaceae]|uniref:Uncharacterized protein n=1 Tax=Peribacillus huizhouensis TaxID=1501239 RepID=A0ABR6CRJ6_9BACI|nr:MULTISPECIES: hypothetical protein [Bacillaceae]MBA9027653.1 hypothetical protein [Peribacillus huizhouensis]
MNKRIKKLKKRRFVKIKEFIGELIGEGIFYLLIQMISLPFRAFWWVLTKIFDQFDWN